MTSGAVPYEVLPKPGGGRGGRGIAEEDEERERERRAPDLFTGLARGDGGARPPSDGGAERGLEGSASAAARWARSDR